MIPNGYELIAHRGLHNSGQGIPENSLPAFSRAVKAGVAIELDVHLTLDGKIVVFHDDDLKRMTGKEKQVEDCTLLELSGLRLSGTDCGIPLFSQVLDLVEGRVPLLIELKDNSLGGRLAEAVLEQLSGYFGEYMIQSFNPYVLLWLRRNAPHVRRGQLSQRCFPAEKGPSAHLEGGRRSTEGQGSAGGRDPAEGQGLAGFLEKSRRLLKNKFLGNMVFNGLTKPDFISYKIGDMTSASVERWRKKGCFVLAWTVRREDQLRKAKRLGCGAIFEGDII